MELGGVGLMMIIMTMKMLAMYYFVITPKTVCTAGCSCCRVEDVCIIIDNNSNVQITLLMHGLSPIVH